jgi:hypothetical protein
MTQPTLFPIHGAELAPRVERTVATGPAEDLPRLNGQCQAILERLRLGPATNAELSVISLKYTGRLSDLRKAGYVIDAKRCEGGIWTYTLKHE